MGHLTLRSGDALPAFGLGTWLSEPGEVYQAVRRALELGYRHIDCAWIYQNEAEIGKALEDAMAAGDVKREALWVTSKLWNDAHAPEHVRPALAGTLKDLRLEYIDLYLVHWPVAHRHGVARPRESSDFLPLEQMPLEKTWGAMVELEQTDLVRNVGVSNHSLTKIDQITRAVGTRPAVNQVEMHPFHQQRELLAGCKSRDVVVTAYSPLGSRGRPEGMKRDDEVPLLEQPALAEVAAELDATPGQVLIAWALARGTAVIPKSTNADRIAQNLRGSEIELTPRQVGRLDELERGERYVTGDFWCPPGSPYTLASLWG